MIALIGIVALLLCAHSDASRAAAFGTNGFTLSRVSNRLITPNGDGRNDGATFVFDNARGSVGTI
jgi:very-short-patch-repair endonuclease